MSHAQIQVPIRGIPGILGILGLIADPWSRELEVAVYWRDYRAMSALRFLRLEDYIDTQQVFYLFVFINIIRIKCHYTDASPHKAIHFLKKNLGQKFGSQILAINLLKGYDSYRMRY